MKKVMFAAAVAATMLAIGENVQSGVVGYSTLQPTDKSIMMGMPFCGTNGGDNTIDSVAGAFESGDQIQVAFMEDGLIDFTTYFYLTEDDDLVDQDGWYDGDDEYIGDTLPIPQGSAVWFISSSDSPKDLTRSGGVGSQSVTRNNFTVASNMICGAFPLPFNPNDARFTWNVSSGDQIQVAFTDNGLIDFTTYFYLTEDDDLVDQDGWYDGDDEFVTEPIAAIGQGFWLVLTDPENSSVIEASPVVE